MRQPTVSNYTKRNKTTTSTDMQITRNRIDDTASYVLTSTADIAAAHSMSLMSLTIPAIVQIT